MKLTEWFPPEVEPAIPGVYERNDDGTLMFDGEPNYSFWDGRVWRSSGATVSSAATKSSRDRLSYAQKLPWRGLAEKP